MNCINWQGIEHTGRHSMGLAAANRQAIGLTYTATRLSISHRDLREHREKLHTTQTNSSVASVISVATSVPWLGVGLASRDWWSRSFVGGRHEQATVQAGEHGSIDALARDDVDGLFELGVEEA